MTSLTILLICTASLAAFTWLGIRAFNRDKWERQKTERKEAWYKYRLESKRLREERKRAKEEQKRIKEEQRRLERERRRKRRS